MLFNCSNVTENGRNRMFNATDLNRLLGCNGSRLMTSEKVVDLEPTYRNEGIAAHWLSCQKVQDLSSFIGKKAANGLFISEEMVEYTQIYTDKIRSRNLYLNQEDDVSFNLVNARCDNWSFNQSTGVLFVDDFKYGFSIVEPFDNWSLKAYAIGVIRNNPFLDNYCTSVVVTVHQPRPYHIDGQERSCTYSRNEINRFETELRYTLENLTDFLSTGPHCTKCPHLAQCSPARKASLNAVEISEKAMTETIPVHELSYELDLLRRAKKAIEDRLNAIEQLSQHKIKSGNVVENYVVENGTGHAKWNENVTPEFLKMISGLNLTTEKILTPAQAKKKGLSPEIVEMLSHKPSTGFRLKRVNTNERAKKLFQR